MQEEYNVELKSDEYNEIVGAVPPAIIRYGTGILLTILLMIIILSTKIHYKTYTICSVSIEQVFSSPTVPTYIVNFQVKPEDISLIHEGQNALIGLLQYPSHHFRQFDYRHSSGGY